MAPPAGDTGIGDVAVVGAGTMGHAIALGFALGRLDVTLFDVDDDVLSDARATVDSAAATLVEEDHLAEDAAAAALDRIEYDRSLESAVASADLVTEAVPERFDLKKAVFADLDAFAPDDAVLATNTSGLSIDEIAGVVDDPSRVVGTHYFNPAHIVPVVEIVRGDATTDAIVDRLYALFEAIGKTPVVVQEDIPGFIANRIQLAMAYEAESLVQRGIASPEDVDRAVKGSFGFRIPTIGVLEKADHAGLDVHHAVTSYLMADLDRGTTPHEFVDELVEEGHYGIKTGKGIYDWSDRDPAAVLEERDRQLLAQLRVYEQGRSE